MRTTITIDDELFRSAKSTAAAEGRTLGSLIEDALRGELARRQRRDQPVPTLPVFGRSGTRPGVDLGDAGALADLMDEGEPSDARR